MDWVNWAYDHPRWALLLAAVGWKLLCFTLVALSPGPGYDTSTKLAFPDLDPLAQKLIRWDSIYFLAAARRDKVFEQEWAFGQGTSLLVRYFSNLLSNVFPSMHENLDVWVGLAITNSCHVGSILVLHELSLAVFQSHEKARQFALISATAHILSPAGIFLASIYGESPTSLLQFLGFYLYNHGRSNSQYSFFLVKSLSLIGSGLFFGLATTARSNGVLGGVMFAVDAALLLVKISKSGLKPGLMLNLIVICMGGVLVGSGTLLPQLFAYLQFCHSSVVEARWCKDLPPSIYAFVQSHYWNTGLFRYWTIPNIPLFAFATPIYAIIFSASLWIINETQKTGFTADFRLLSSLPAMILALLTLSSYHVQITTRLISGYPLASWWLAHNILGGDHDSRPRILPVGRIYQVLSCLIWYIVLQGGLFASFLPPA